MEIRQNSTNEVLFELETSDGLYEEHLELKKVNEVHVAHPKADNVLHERVCNCGDTALK